MKINFLHLKGISANTLSAYPEMHIFYNFIPKRLGLALVHNTEKTLLFNSTKCYHDVFQSFPPRPEENILIPKQNAVVSLWGPGKIYQVAMGWEEPLVHRGTWTPGFPEPKQPRSTWT